MSTKEDKQKQVDDFRAKCKAEKDGVHKKKADDWKAQCKEKSDAKKRNANPGSEWRLASEIAAEYKVPTEKIMELALRILPNRGWNICWGTINKPVFDAEVARRGGMANLI